MNIVNELTPEHVAYWADHDGYIAKFTSPNERAVGIEPAIGTHLARGGTIWLSTWGGLPPHALEVQAP